MSRRSEDYLCGSLHPLGKASDLLSEWNFLILRLKPTLALASGLLGANAGKAWSFRKSAAMSRSAGQGGVVTECHPTICSLLTRRYRNGMENHHAELPLCRPRGRAHVHFISTLRLAHAKRQFSRRVEEWQCRRINLHRSDICVNCLD